MKEIISKYTGYCTVCDGTYQAGDTIIQTGTRPHKTKPSRTVKTYAHIECFNKENANKEENNKMEVYLFNGLSAGEQRKIISQEFGNAFGSEELRKLKKPHRIEAHRVMMQEGRAQAIIYVNKALNDIDAPEYDPVKPELVEHCKACNGREYHLNAQGLCAQCADAHKQADPLPNAEPVKAPEAPVKPQKADKVEQLQSLINDIVNDNGVDKAEVEAIVKETVKTELAKQAPARVEIIQNDEKIGEIEGHTHPLFEKVYRLCQAGLNVLLVGPSGCGKTHLAEQIAKAANKPFGSFPYTAGATEANLVGRLLPIGEGGRFEYVPSEFVDMYCAEAAEKRGDNGGVFLHDEIDGADPNMLLVLNSATSNGGFHIEQRKASGLNTYVKKANGCWNIGAANTFGRGAGAMFVGRSPLDVATLDRWYIVCMNYDASYEASLYGGQAEREVWTAAPKPTAQEIKSLSKWVLSVREKAEKTKLRRVISTRAIQKAIAARHAGVPTEEIKQDLLSGWTEDEKAKVA